MKIPVHTFSFEQFKVKYLKLEDVEKIFNVIIHEKDTKEETKKYLEKTIEELNNG